MANNPNVLKNLKPFKKGQTGNPNGRPHKLPDLQIILAEVLGKETNGKTAAQKILDALQKRSLKGGAEGNRAAEILLNRGYGLPKQYVDMTTNGQTLNTSINLFPPGTEETFEIKEGE